MFDKNDMKAASAECSKEQCLTVKSAAAILRVHPDTVRRWIDHGHLEAARHPINRYRIVPLRALESLKAKLP